MQLTAAPPDPTTPPARVPAGPDPAAELPLTVIDGRTTWTVGDVREMWRFRELFFFLTLRDIKIRYKQTIFGVGWSVFQPLATVAVFVVFLGKLGHTADGIEDYTLFCLCGVLPWMYFQNATSNAANSLTGNERLVTRTYFPRVFLPASNVGAATFDFAIALLVLAGWAVAAGPPPTWRLLLLPGLIGLLAATAFGFGTLLSALIASQRDFRYLLSFGIQLWMFATPCIYLKADAFTDRTRELLQLNPLYGLILNFRNAVMGWPVEWPALAISAAAGLATVVFGAVYFRKVETTLADTL